MKLFYLILIVFGSSIAIAQKPTIQFTHLVVDKGVIFEGSDGIFKFPFQNIGDSPLIISSVKSSCGCLVPWYGKEPIMPGAWDTIKTKYDTKRIGPSVKTITVYSNDSLNETVTLRVKCEVRFQPILEIILQKNGKPIEPSIDNSFNLSVVKDSVTNYSFTITNLSKDPRTISISKQPLNWQFSFSKIQLDETSKELMHNESIEIFITNKSIEFSTTQYFFHEVIIDGIALKIRTE